MQKHNGLKIKKKKKILPFKNYDLLAVMPGVAWDFWCDKHINLT